MCHVPSIPHHPTTCHYLGDLAARPRGPRLTIITELCSSRTLGTLYSLSPGMMADDDGAMSMCGGVALTRNLATTLPPRNCSTSLASLGLSGTHLQLYTIISIDTDHCCSQVRQGIANNTKGTAFVVFEDVMDAKQACDKLNGFNFQSRYLVGMCTSFTSISSTAYVP